MAALFVALGGLCTIWTEGGGERMCVADDFVTGAGRNSLRPGEVLRSVFVARSMLELRPSFRKMSLTEGGRSAALLIGVDQPDGVALTIAASVARPVRFLLPKALTQAGVAARIDEFVPSWYDDLHGAPVWRRQITHHLARDIYAEFFG
jgi:CO/xanthine dehydrogenase FAD-binding subunit